MDFLNISRASPSILLTLPFFDSSCDRSSQLQRNRAHTVVPLKQYSRRYLRGGACSTHARFARLTSCRCYLLEARAAQLKIGLASVDCAALAVACHALLLLPAGRLLLPLPLSAMYVRPARARLGSPRHPRLTWHQPSPSATLDGRVAGRQLSASHPSLAALLCCRPTEQSPPRRREGSRQCDQFPSFTLLSCVARALCERRCVRRTGVGGWERSERDAGRGKERTNGGSSDAHACDGQLELPTTTIHQSYYN